MMRSLTIGVPIWTQSVSKLIGEVESFSRQSDKLLLNRRIEARTKRITFPSVPKEIILQQGAILSVLASVREISAKAGARWYCLPIDMTLDIDYEAFLTEILNLLVKDERLFVNLIVAKESGISLRGANLAARFVLNLSRRSHNGFDNFRVGVSSACKPNTPFFPFSSHEGEEVAFSLALETTKDCIQAVESQRSKHPCLTTMRDALKKAIEIKVIEANDFGLLLERDTGIEYKGLDASYAPLPDNVSSVGTLIELFGASPVGSNGTLFVTSILTDTLKSVLQETNVRCIGFNGVMYSVLEDTKLASSNNLTNLTIEKLALFSTLCGCGIDMVPIPGITYVEDIAAIILDISSLAVRLKKPLGVRLIPVSNKLINEYAVFNQDFLCDSRVMNVGISDTSLTLSSTQFWQYLN